MKYISFRHKLLITVIILALSFIAHTAGAGTVSSVYPLLSDRFLKSAELVDATDDLILKTDTGISLSAAALEQSLNQYDPRLKDQLENNLVFLLEQEIVTRVLLYEAEKSGLSAGKTDKNDQIQAYLSARISEISVSQEEARTFYDENKEMVGGIPFEQVQETIQNFLAGHKKQEAVSAHIDDLGRQHHLQINKQWMDTHYSRMKNNPVDAARSSGKVSMIEFGATGCIPCDMMQPVMESLKKKFPETLNVVFVQVHEHQILSSRFGIQSIPVQVFFDRSGNETFRHAGFFAEKDILTQLEKMGVIQ